MKRNQPWDFCFMNEAFNKLHEKNKEVMDSIYYARRIQRALITSEKYIARKLNSMAGRSRSKNP